MDIYIIGTVQYIFLYTQPIRTFFLLIKLKESGKTRSIMQSSLSNIRYGHTCVYIPALQWPLLSYLENSF